MDAHLLTKIIHMTAVAAALMVLYYALLHYLLVYKVNNLTQQGVKF